MNWWMNSNKNVAKIRLDWPIKCMHTSLLHGLWSIHGSHTQPIHYRRMCIDTIILNWRRDQHIHMVVKMAQQTLANKLIWLVYFSTEHGLTSLAELLLKQTSILLIDRWRKKLLNEEKSMVQINYKLVDNILEKKQRSTWPVDCTEDYAKKCECSILVNCCKSIIETKKDMNALFMLLLL
jgi:hypothetical protein